jgi:alpha-tubulin suppressor-like RCC1 family protein
MGLSDYILTIKNDGSVWTWGNNPSGQLGDNSTVNKSSPVLVVGSHSFVEIVGGGSHSIARKSDGSVWTWGYNTYGQLGDNSTVSKSSPVAVVGSHSFVEVTSGANHSLARKSDGSVWTWGYNLYGQLGDNSTVSKSSPVLVVGGILHVTLDYFTYLRYKTGATPDAVNDAPWQEYREPFTSLGYVQTKVGL